MNTAFLTRASAVLPLLLLFAAPACRAVPVTVDPQALALLQRVQLASQKMHSFSAEMLQITRRDGHDLRQTGTVRLMKPNYGCQQLWDVEKDMTSGLWKKKGQSIIWAADGKKSWFVTSDGKAYHGADNPQGSRIGANLLSEDFFGPANSLLFSMQHHQADINMLILSDAGSQQWAGQTCRVLELRRDTSLEHPASVRQSVPAGTITENDRLYINSDNILCRTTMTDSIGNSGEAMLRDIRINAPLTAANFKLVPPPHMQIVRSYVAPPLPKPLLAVGTAAPDFAAVAPDGSTVHLSDYKGKTVVLDFWSTWCGPCQMSMPHLEKVYSQVKDKNVAVLGVCVFDDKAAYDKWVTDKKGVYDFPTAFDPAGRGKNSIASKLYHVSGIPTQYVIDKDGKIAASTVGYDEGGTELEDALKKQGVEIAVPVASK